MTGWINDGFARYSEALYVEHVAGEAGFEEVTREDAMEVGALAYETVPLAQVTENSIPSRPSFNR